MRSRIKRAFAVTGCSAVAIVPFMASGAAHAAPGLGRTIYASQNRSLRPDGRTCRTGYPTIQQAVNAARPGDTVVVCPSRAPYRERDILIKTPGIILEGTGRPVIERPGGLINSSTNGIDVRADGVVVRSLVVEGFPACGISVSGAEHDQISGNAVSGNDVGICVIGSSFARVIYNVASANDEAGIALLDSNPFVRSTAKAVGPPPTCSDNTIGSNSADKNGYVGILLAGLGPATAGPVTAGPPPGGVFDNNVIGNEANGNGRSKRLAELSPMPAPEAHTAGIMLTNDIEGSDDSDPDGSGSVHDNLVAANQIAYNGGPGVSVLAEIAERSKAAQAQSAAAKPVPGGNMNGNIISRNTIGLNNLSPGAVPKPVEAKGDLTSSTVTRTTGVLIVTKNPISVHVIYNQIGKDYYGIVTTSSVSTISEFLYNIFLYVLFPIHVMPPFGA